MRRLFVLAAALAMMVGLHALRVDADAGASDPMTLAAIGFVLLAAFSIGEMGGALGLPKVTGYILAGVALGPQVLDILSERVVDELGMFNTLALGLIATTAGLELNIAAIRRVSRTLLATVGAKLLLLPIFVGGPFLLIQHFWPFFALDGWTPVLVLALVISVLGLGTSPAIALAVVNDTGAKGRLSDLLLTIAVVKDLVVVTCLAIAIAGSHSMLSGAGELDVHVILRLGEELGASVGVGAVVGALLILYFRFAKTDALFSVLVMILIVAELSHVLHLELLLVFIVAGFVVRNFSTREHALLTPLERIALPVFIVFFTTAGAGVDLRGTMAILPLALTLSACRVGAYFLAGRLGARLGGEGPAVASNAWLTYVPQAGVTLGLVLLAAQALPELSGPITRLGMALVAINLLAGPILLSIGLGRAGETRAARATTLAASDATQPEPVASPAGAAEEQPAPATDLPPPPPLPRQRVLGISDPTLRALAVELAEQIQADIDVFLTTEIHTRLASLETRALHLVAQQDSRAALLRSIRHGLAGTTMDADEAWEPAVTRLVDALTERILALPSRLDVPLDTSHLARRPGDALGVRLRRTRARWRLRLAPAQGTQRQVPIRMAARVALDARVAEAGQTLAGSWFRTQGQVLAQVRRTLREELSSDPTEEIKARLARWGELVHRDLLHAASSGMEEWAALLDRLGTPEMADGDLRYAEVETRVRSARLATIAAAPVWRHRSSAAVDTLRAAVWLETFALRVDDSLDQRARQPLRILKDTLPGEIDGVIQRLEAIEHELEGAKEQDSGRLERMRAQSEQAFPKAHAQQIRRTRARFRRATQPNLLVGDLAELLDNAPGELRLIPPYTPLEHANWPDQVEVWEVPFAPALEGLLQDDLVPQINQALIPTAELVAELETRLRDAVNVTHYGIELAQRGGFESEKAAEEVISESIRRSCRRLLQVREKLVSSLQAGDAELARLGQDSRERLAAMLTAPPRASVTRVRLSLRSIRLWLAQHGGLMADQVLARARKMGLAARALSKQQSIRDLRIRSTHELLDATSMRAYLRTFYPQPNERGLPAMYVHLLSSEPISDRRLFEANRELLEGLAPMLGDETDSGVPSVLLVGPPGSGRTSLLNVLQLRISTARVIRPDGSFASRREGPLAALAADLGVPPNVASLVDALRSKPAIVLLDNLEHWLLPTPDGLAALESLLEVVDQTTPGTRWVVSLSAPAFDLLRQVVPLRQAFASIVQVAPLGWQEIRRVIDERERLGGFDSEVQRTGLGRLARLLRPAREKEAYFRALTRVSHGHLSAAFQNHLRCVKKRDESRLALTLPTRAAVPFLHQLSNEALAVLSLLARFGPMDTNSLMEALGQQRERLDQTLYFLLLAGLLEDMRPPLRWLRIPLYLRPAVLEGLWEQHVLPEVRA